MLQLKRQIERNPLNFIYSRLRKRRSLHIGSREPVGKQKAYPDGSFSLSCLTAYGDLAVSTGYLAAFRSRIGMYQPILIV
ncbi:hypothetical protein BH10ACI2_BH10ACI2_10320 [soil metagenome]